MRIIVNKDKSEVQFSDEEFFQRVMTLAEDEMALHHEESGEAVLCSGLFRWKDGKYRFVPEQ